MFIKHQRNNFQVNTKRLVFEGGAAPAEGQSVEQPKPTTQEFNVDQAIDSNIAKAVTLIDYYGKESKKGKDLQKMVDEVRKAQESQSSAREFVAAKLSTALSAIPKREQDKALGIMEMPEVVITSKPKGKEKITAADRALLAQLAGADATVSAQLAALGTADSKPAVTEKPYAAPTATTTEQPLSAPTAAKEAGPRQPEIPPSVKAVLRNTLDTHPELVGTSETINGYTYNARRSGQDRNVYLYTREKAA